jgi:molybdopterin synthase catalytic subunit
MTFILKDKYLLEVQDNPLEITKGYDFCLDERAGAIVIFSGTVRNHNELTDTVNLIDYQIWESKALEIMEDLAGITFDKYCDLVKIYIAHRFGKLNLKEESILIIVSSPHRKAAYEASEFLIDTIKKTLPVWKLEYFNGSVQPSSDTMPISSLKHFL